MKQETNSSKPRKNTIGDVIRKILIVILVGVAAFSGWKVFSILQKGNEVEKENKELEQYVVTSTENEDPVFAPDWAALKNANPNIRAWLSVPGTGISTPVVQGADNQYYLEHTSSGEPSYLGAIFLDAQANPNFTDSNSIIYGHSTDTGNMFTPLKKFLEPQFFNDHPYFWLMTPERNYKCDILCVYQGPDSGAVYTVDFGDQREWVLNEVQTTSVEYREGLDLTDKNFVTLGTCDLKYGFDSDQRIAVMAVLNPYDQPILESETK